MSEGHVLYGSYNGVQILRYIGDVRYTLSLALDACINSLLEDPELKGFVADLSGTESIDSTNLGILARLARAMQRQGLPKVTLISDRPSINEILEGMGFDRVFKIVSERDRTLDEMRRVPAVTSDDSAMLRLLLESHRSLMELNEANRRQFQDVVDAFQKEAEKLPR